MGFWSRFLGFDPNRKRSFPGQQPGEEVIYMGVFHWMVLGPFILQFGSVFLALILINVYGSFFQDLSPLVRLYVNTFVVGITIHIACFRLFNYFLKVMILTNYRLIEIRHSVVLTREREVIPMVNIQDFRYKQNGILARIFGYGDLLVLGANVEVKYQFHLVPKVNRLHHLLCEVHGKAINQYGVYRAQQGRGQQTLPSMPQVTQEPALID